MRTSRQRSSHSPEPSHFGHSPQPLPDLHPDLSHFLQNVVTIFLSDEFGMTDKEAGLCVGAKGFAVSVYGLALGWLVDRLGVRRSLLLGSTLSLCEPKPLDPVRHMRCAWFRQPTDLNS